MIEEFKEAKKLLLKNIKAIIQFEFVFKLITSIIAIPIFLELFTLITKISGYDYITIENIIRIICNPLIIILICLLLLVISFYSIFDIGTIIILLDASRQNKVAKIKNVVWLSLKKSIRIFKPKNFGLLILVIFLIPFLNMGISTGVITSIHLPEFIMDFILANPLYTFLFIAVTILFLILFIRWMYTLHYYFLDDKSFAEARRSSNLLSKKSKLKDFLKLITPQIGIGIAFIITVLICIGLILLINKIFNNISLLNSTLISIIVFFLAIVSIIYSIINIAIGYSCVSVMFYKHKNEKKENINDIKIKEYDKIIPKKRWKIINIVLILIGIISLIIVNYDILTGKFNYNDINYYRNLEITAHRGASAYAPENTMSAFVKAYELGADWIELDVQQTKDRQVIVSHDTNLKRITGENINTWDTTYEEISKLDAGSFKSEEFKGEKIPLLDDVIKWASENNVKLNIEIKPTGYEENFEKQVIDIINKYNYQNNCVVTSQEYTVLEKLKEVDSNIKTVYVMSIAIGNLNSFDKSDYFSIEASNITEDMVNKIHKDNKQIYAWTINTEESIESMIDLNVDNIITDDVPLAQEIRNENLIKTTDIYSIIKYVEKSLRTQ